MANYKVVEFIGSFPSPDWDQDVYSWDFPKDEHKSYETTLDWENKFDARKIVAKALWGKYADDLMEYEDWEREFETWEEDYMENRDVPYWLHYEVDDGDNIELISVSIVKI